MSVEYVASSAVHREIYAACGIPVSGSETGQAIRGSAGSIEVERAQAVQPDGDGVYTRSLHQLGSPLVDLRTFRLPAKVSHRPPPLAYGPGTDRPILPMVPFKGLGTSIHRDDPQISSNYAQVASLAKPWLRPGFPATPRFQNWRVEGRKVRGVLASSIDRPGGYVVLEAVHMAQLMGYGPAVLPAHFKEEDLDGLVPLECLHRLLDWAESVLSIPFVPTSRSATGSVAR